MCCPVESLDYTKASSRHEACCMSARSRCCLTIIDGDETVFVIPRRNTDETTPLPLFPLVKVREFVVLLLVFALSRATVGVVPRFLILFLMFWSLPAVALPPPRMVLVGALVQVLLVPPSGYRCFRRRPGCRASARGVFVAHCFPSSLCLMATKALALCGDLSLYTMFPVLLGCCVLPH